MNRAEILNANGTINPEKCVPLPKGSPLAEVTVREYCSRRASHDVVMSGPMTFGLISALAAGKTSLPLDAE